MCCMLVQYCLAHVVVLCSQRFISGAGRFDAGQSTGRRVWPLSLLAPDLQALSSALIDTDFPQKRREALWRTKNPAGYVGRGHTTAGDGLIHACAASMTSAPGVLASFSLHSLFPTL